MTMKSLMLSVASNTPETVHSHKIHPELPPLAVHQKAFEQPPQHTFFDLNTPLALDSLFPEKKINDNSYNNANPNYKEKTVEKNQEPKKPQSVCQ